MHHLKTYATSTAARRILLICDILLHTGLRAFELCRLRVQDTPFVLRVNVIEVYRGKNNKDRGVDISKRLSGEISNYIKHLRSATMPRHIKRGDVSKPLFYSQHRKPYTTNALYRLIGKLGERAGLSKHLHTHMFRHTFAVNALLKGVDIYLLQQLMGHSDITTTAQYLHIVNAHIKGLGEKLDIGYCPPATLF